MLSRPADKWLVEYRFTRLLLLLVLALTASACAGTRAQSPAVPLANLATPVAQVVATNTPPPPTAVPSGTLTPTATPTVTTLPTNTATPTSTPEHPLMIDVMRRATYPGSEMIIETTLDPGENYDRYIASYLSDGHKIYGLLTRPFGQRPPTGFPVILFNHGYIPPAEYRTTLRYLDYVDYFARAGYMVFRSDYRGHGDSEGVAGGAYSTPNYTVDVLNALAAVKTLPSADPNRIGMWGHSMGGYITLRSMIISDEVKAGVIWGGVVGPYPDLFARGAATATAVATLGTPDAVGGDAPVFRFSRWRGDLYNTYGSPEENPAFWNSISANAYLSEISGPIQLHHGLADDIVPAAVSVLLHEQMQAAGQHAELYLYEADNHNISLNFYPAMRRSLEFFDRYVKGE
jgi:uncharacterized protein